MHSTLGSNIVIVLQFYILWYIYCNANLIRSNRMFQMMQNELKVFATVKMCLEVIPDVSGLQQNVHLRHNVALMYIFKAKCVNQRYNPRVNIHMYLYNGYIHIHTHILGICMCVCLQYTHFLTFKSIGYVWTFLCMSLYFSDLRVRFFTYWAMSNKIWSSIN